jgi:hypothetical protein
MRIGGNPLSPGRIDLKDRGYGQESGPPGLVPARRASITRRKPPGGARLPDSATGILTAYPDWASRKQKDQGYAPALPHPRAPESTKKPERKASIPLRPAARSDGGTYQWHSYGYDPAPPPMHHNHQTTKNRLGEG